MQSPTSVTPARRRPAVVAAVVALLGQLLIGTAVAATPTSPSPGSIAWVPCESPYGEGDFECGTLTVPVNWQHPDGTTVDLALARHRATDPGRRIGPLLLNPGGPGQSGVNLALSAPFSFSPEVVARFDLVGFDPRGIGGSSEMHCDGEKVEARRAALSPTDEASFQTLRQANRALADNCREVSGPLADHMDTKSVAYDMDAIRAALGEQRISYWGGSYGTLIGQQYAELFPHRVRAMVLDSNMDHSLGAWGILKSRTETLEASFGLFADWCERTPSCLLYGKDVRALYKSYYQAAEEGRLVYTLSNRPFPASTLRGTTYSYMYEPDNWPTFALVLSYLSVVAEPPTETASEAPSAQAAAGDPVAFTYDPVLCQDFDLDVPSYATMARYETELARIAPLTRVASLGWSYLTSCQNWTDRVANPQHPLRVDGTPPILLTNSRYDVATPYAWAANAARQMGREARLLTYDGVGHITYWRSPCMRAAVDTYLTTLETPAKDTHCPAIWPGTSQAAAQQLAPGGGLVDPYDLETDHS
ncbi:alpha/beta hydrolase [Streptomyces fulvoviolaceus]|uniref:alpha/beta hydrolase n=1 Tax=Streptomyces fulvoviolaceus TaxID=285535 RepID=UPI0021C1B11E|nr:alpha/beta hydrolase [Streptomyces fulvoviolaceus]MCT9081457.1 alpha/beta hydrolase [Streptomyces fulvoviolaceus]